MTLFLQLTQQNIPKTTAFLSTTSYKILVKVYDFSAPFSFFLQLNSMFTWALLASSLFLLGALALAMCAEQESEDQNEADQEEQQQQQPRTSSVSSKEKAPRKTKSKVQSKVQSKVGGNSKVGGTSKVTQSAVKGGRSSAAPSAAVSGGAKLLPKKKLSGKGKGKGQARAKDSLSAESAVSEVKSTGADYYAILVKQCTVKSVSQYGMPPPPPPPKR